MNLIFNIKDFSETYDTRAELRLTLNSQYIRLITSTLSYSR